MKLRFSDTAWAYWVVSVALSWPLAGCSILPTVPQNLESTVQTQAAVELKNVPFFAQKDFHCGPSTLAMVLNHAGEKTEPNQLAELVYLPGRRGSLQMEMLSAPRQMGYLSYQISPNLPALFAALNSGTPVVVLLNLSLQFAPQWHYAVVVGYEPSGQNVILRSGSKQRERIPVATFLKLWERSENWGFTVITPLQPPPSYVNAQAYLNSAVALERSNPKNAGEAYQQGAKTWPNEERFYFGLGNLAYSAKNFAEAEKHYQKTVEMNPAMADAWNNLAQALVQLERKNEARVAINKAIAIGGSRISVYQETAEKLKTE